MDGSVDLTLKDGTLTSWAVGPEFQVEVTELAVDQAGSALGLSRFDVSEWIPKRQGGLGD